MASVALTRRFDLTDAQWAILGPLLPLARRSCRPSKWTKRQLIDGIRWRVRTGSPWRDVPACYGSWQAVYGLFRRWQRNGTWARVLAGLQARADAAGLIGWDVGVDSTIMRAHQHAAGARRRGDLQREPPGGAGTEPGDHSLGRSRGGLSTKVHLACEQGHKPLSLVVTAGQRGDAPQFEAVMAGVRVARQGRGRPRTRPDPGAYVGGPRQVAAPESSPAPRDDAAPAQPGSQVDRLVGPDRTSLVRADGDVAPGTGLPGWP
ncbi:IS5 family transposase [Actinomadura physcomitrii]|uniref:IS5 family transposase n=1 Tax=Actinomadura physcomitrii TaxID=2650748 RepID=UPI0019227F18|nr:IS5 family transposase [Actinomadura physcomitrii]